MKDNILSVLSALTNAESNNTMNESTAHAVVKDELQVLSALNESTTAGATVESPLDDPNIVVPADPRNTIVDDDTASTIVRCPVCNAYVYDEDIVGGVCPVCQTVCDNFIAVTSDTPDGALLASATTSPKVTLTNESLEPGALLESANLNEAEIFVESMKKVIRGGQVVKVKVKHRKVKLTSAQKSALRKARKKSHTSSAQRSRTKSIKIRTRKGL